MDSFFIFLFKSCLWVSAFWIVYRLFLRNETFYAFNRRFLLVGLSLSFILPLFRFYYPKVIVAAPIESPDWVFTVIDDAAVLPTPVMQASPTLGWMHIAVAIYAAVALFQLARSLMEVRRINRLIAKYGYTQHSGYRLVELDLPVAPFSFRNYIFINRDKITGIESGVIIAHESAHIRQRHWIDLIAGAALRIVQWINPFAFLLVRGIKENHEFMADKAVLADGNSIAVYKAVLINSSLGERVFTLGHPFSSSNNLKRHKMMNKKLSSVSRKWSVLTILPLAALFFMAFAKPRYTMIETSPAPMAQEVVGVIGAITPEQTSVDEPPVITASDSVTVKIDGSNTSVELHGRVQATTDSTRAVKAGKPIVDPYRYLKILRIVADSVSKNEMAMSADSLPLIIVDGIERSSEYVQKMKAKEIKMMTVLKDEKTKAQYGARGKNGVILIETETGAKERDNALAPLIFVDGHRVNMAIMKSLSPDKIESVVILKDKAAVELYGEDARNGVIVIKLKPEQEDSSDE